MDINQLSSKIIGAAIEVHKTLGLDYLNLLMKNVCATN